ncbi:MAG: FadR/GntR family transcriptional regulator [Pseudonocardia sp.]
MKDDSEKIVLSLDTGRPLPDVIADTLTDLIDREVYPPGGRLPNESELARRMGVARSSVRTALQRLDSRKVLEVRRGLGWYVRKRRPAERVTLSGLLAEQHYQLSDLFELRIGLEDLAVSLAAVRATATELDEITKLNLAHAFAGEDRDELQRTDEAMHEAVVRASHNDLLVTNYRDVVAGLSEWRRQSYGSAEVARRSAREHSRVIRYLGNGDPDGARGAMKGHLLRVYYEIAEITETPLDLGAPHSGK